MFLSLFSASWCECRAASLSACPCFTEFWTENSLFPCLLWFWWSFWKIWNLFCPSRWLWGPWGLNLRKKRSRKWSQTSIRKAQEKSASVTSWQWCPRKWYGCFTAPNKWNSEGGSGAFYLLLGLKHCSSPNNYMYKNWGNPYPGFSHFSGKH